MAIQFVVNGARISKASYDSYLVLHGSNDAILAYCDTLVDAEYAVALLNKLSSTAAHGAYVDITQGEE